MSQVDELVASGRLQDAANLASERADYARAAQLFEQACMFADAAKHWRLAGQGERALLWAAIADDSDEEEAALTLLASVPTSVDALRRAALLLESKGRLATAAKAYERASLFDESAELWERAQQWVHAARAWEAAGKLIKAGKAYELGLRASPNDGDVALALARLLFGMAKWEACVRVLQKAFVFDPPEVSLQTKTALQYLVDCFDKLGLPEAKERAHAQWTRVDVLLRQQRAADSPNAADANEAMMDAHALQHTPDAEPVLRTSVEDDANERFGRYRVEAEIALTSHARVERAVDKLTGQTVAIKTFVGGDAVGAGRDAVLRFEREATIMGRLMHPNVLGLVDYYAEGPALILPWMEHGSLREVLDRNGHEITPARAADWVSAVLSGLAAAHQVGVIHRDVKPSNVLLDRAGSPVLADFGAAHMSDASRTATAAAIGTFAYMSPEQKRGLGATVASDLFGVGVLFLELLTGSTMLERELVEALGLGAPHIDLLTKLTADRPDARPASALDGLREVRALVWPNLLPAQFQRAAPRSLRPQSLAPQALTERYLPHLESSVQEDAASYDASTRGVTWFDDTLTGRTVKRFVLAPEIAERLLRVQSACIEPVVSWDGTNLTVAQVGVAPDAPALSSESLAAVPELHQAMQRLAEAGLVVEVRPNIVRVVGTQAGATQYVLAITPSITLA
jgi:eukaryotic-like serine/threonine-protein kinase